MSSSKVTVGMPVYNAERFIQGALDSLLAQEYKDFELIISDNDSTDGTGKICREYAARDTRIRYIRQSVNKGVEFNFQFVLDQAVGVYFMWAAADDLWNRLFISELVIILDSNPDVVLSFCEHEHMDLNNVVFAKYPQVSKIAVSEGKNKAGKTLGKNSFEKFLLQPSVYGKVNILYGLIRRKELLVADIWHRWGEFGWGMDILCAANILRYGNAAFSSLVLWHKKLNPKSEGSPKFINESPSLFESIRGTIGTLIKYLKFSIGVYRVQSDMPGAKKIKMSRRIFFTAFELFRTTVIFFQQVAHAFMKRLRAYVRGLYYFLIGRIFKYAGVPVTINGYRLRFHPKYYRWFPGDYERDNFEFIAKSLTNDSVFVDIGAHFGLYSIISAKYFGCHVYSFEPTEYSANIFFENINFNSVNEKVNIIKNAVSSKNCRLSFYIQDTPGAVSNSLVDYWHSNESKNRITVDAVSIDSYFIMTKYDFLKIDAEGAEHDILKGATQTIKKYRPKMILALHPNALAAKGGSLKLIWDMLGDLGYSCLLGRKSVTEEEFCSKTGLFDVFLIPGKANEHK